MAVAKRKCRFCKEFFPREEMTIINTGAFCSMDHAIAYAKEKSPQVRKKQARERKREYRKNDLRIRKEAAKRACHEFIRYRDKGRKCISCGKGWDGLFDAGHFLESGNNPHIRYDESNINGQCRKCNRFKGGNSAGYERSLRARIGDSEVDRLLASKGGTLKRTAEDYLEIENYYRERLRELKNDQKNSV